MKHIRNNHILIILGLLLLLLACNGGGDKSSPQLDQLTPADGAKAVEPETLVSVTLNEDIFINSVNNDSLLLSEAVGEKTEGSITLEADGKTVQLIPDNRLALLGNYTATLDETVSDLSGNFLSAPIQWTFSVRDGEWGTSKLVENSNKTVWLPHLLVDSKNNTQVIWAEGSDVKVNRYSHGNGWGSIKTISNGESLAQFPHMAINTKGNAVAVWVQKSIEAKTRLGVWVNLYDPDTGWGNAEQVEVNPGDAIVAKAVIDSDNNITLVWLSNEENTVSSIRSIRYTAGSGWGESILIEDNDTGNANEPQIVIDRQGNATVVWQQYGNSGSSRIYTNRFTQDANWGDALPIPIDLTKAAANSYNPQLGIDLHGNAIVVWHQDYAGVNIYASHYMQGVGWDVGKPIESNGIEFYGDPAHLAVDPQGNAIVVWRQIGQRTSNIYTNTYQPDIGWGTTTLIGSGDTGDAESPWVAIDQLGNAIAMWHQFDGIKNNIWANRYVNGSGWNGAQLIESDDIKQSRYPQVAFDSQGNAIAIWELSDGFIDNIMFNRFE